LAIQAVPTTAHPAPAPGRALNTALVQACLVAQTACTAASSVDGGNAGGGTDSDTLNGGRDILRRIGGLASGGGLRDDMSDTPAPSEDQDMDLDLGLDLDNSFGGSEQDADVPQSAVPRRVDPTRIPDRSGGELALEVLDELSRAATGLFAAVHRALAALPLEDGSGRSRTGLGNAMGGAGSHVSGGSSATSSSAASSGGGGGEGTSGGDSALETARASRASASAAASGGGAGRSSSKAAAIAGSSTADGGGAGARAIRSQSRGRAVLTGSEVSTLLAQATAEAAAIDARLAAVRTAIIDGPAKVAPATASGAGPTAAPLPATSSSLSPGSLPPLLAAATRAVAAAAAKWDRVIAGVRQWRSWDTVPALPMMPMQPLQQTIATPRADGALNHSGGATSTSPATDGETDRAAEPTFVVDAGVRTVRTRSVLAAQRPAPGTRAGHAGVRATLGRMRGGKAAAGGFAFRSRIQTAQR
jgi:hypothetical protein